jgi:hypothetical protein
MTVFIVADGTVNIETTSLIIDNLICGVLLVMVVEFVIKVFY